MRYTQGLIGLLILAELVLAGSVLWGDYHQETVCVFGSGCSEVQHSIYSTILGIKVSMFGFISFILLAILYVLSHTKTIKPIVFVSVAKLGAFFSLYFLIIQFFVLKKICSTCLVIDIMMILIASLAIYDLLKNKNY
ncbi:hypothetical protein KW805_01625 [Candidatus Pacearchaeota archaeon]|nr:hypothetical protein [Candidatus Pacearchaeota archaeon]